MPAAQVANIGWGSLDKISAILNRQPPRRILVVAGATSYETSGAAERLEPLLRGIQVARFSDFSPNPRIEDLNHGVELQRSFQADLMIGVGGGTALDVAKAIRVCASSERSVADLLHDSAALTTTSTRLVAIPTTAGSGSEATQFAVVYVDRRKESLDHPSLLPDYALIDPSLTESLSARMTAITGLDALAQAIESIWSVRADARSLPDARRAASMALEHLPQAVHRPDRRSREGMARAAHLAGRAINRTRTTASHAASYPITILHGVPHGHAVMLTLPAMLAYNAGVTVTDVQDPRGPAAVRRRIRIVLDILGSPTPEQGRMRLLALLRELDLETSLAELGVRTSSAVEAIVAEGFNPARVGNNPRRLTADALRAMLVSPR